MAFGGHTNLQSVAEGDAGLAGDTWGQSEMSLKKALIELGEIFTGAKYKVGVCQPLYIPPSLPACLTSIPSLNKCLFVEHSGSKTDETLGMLALSEEDS